jgi:hypothetical protein
MGATNLRPDRDGDDFWAITSYFNPAGYRSKYVNYQQFRKHLAVPLMAIELSYGPDFELKDDDAEIVLRRRGRDVLWQKERLLNIALAALPSRCRRVAWVDCDVIFESRDWPGQTRSQLDRFALVQLFSHVYRLPQGCGPDQERPPNIDFQNSVSFLIDSGMPTWAAGRELLESHGLYDACIVGGGDAAMVRAAYGRFEDALRLQCLDRDHYLAWAMPFHQAVRSNVGHVAGNLLHLWHGDTSLRSYRQRNSDLAKFEFNPAADIAADCNDVWRWSSDKPAMHEFVRNYFRSRREDG